MNRLPPLRGQALPGFVTSVGARQRCGDRRAPYNDLTSEIRWFTQVSDALARAEF